MSKAENILAEIEKLQLKAKRSRNQAEKATIKDQIDLKMKELNSVNEKEVKKEIRRQKDAPDVMDHSNTNNMGRGSITNTGDTFIGIL